MNDELDQKKRRLAEVLHDQKGRAEQERLAHDSDVRERISEIDVMLGSETDPYAIDELNQERDGLVEELSVTGPDLLVDEIADLEKGS